MQEINEFFGRELRPFTRVGADVALSLETEKGIDYWLREFRRKMMNYILKDWRP